MANWKTTIRDLIPKEFVVKVDINVNVNPIYINAPGATIGNLNTGEQMNIGSIDAHIEQLSGGNDKDAADALKALTEAFISNPEGVVRH